MAEPVPVLTPSIPFPPDRAPTAVEMKFMRQLHKDGMSKNQVCRYVYGFKNGKTYSWVTHVLEANEKN
jgi:hypothetical protein